MRIGSLKGALLLCLMAGFVGTLMSCSKTEEKKPAATEAQKPTISLEQRAVDTINVQNVMGRQAYYHMAQRHREEWAALWCKRDDIAFAESSGWFVGSEKIRKYYVDEDEKAMQKDLDNYRKVHPEIPNTKEYWGIGNFIMHPLTTGVIEIAGDGQTAKGMWYTNGGMMINKVTSVDAIWMWETVAADLVKEDGQWKIWHMQMYCDFQLPIGSSWAEKDAADKKTTLQQQGPATGAADGSGMPTLDVPTRYYETYSINRKQTLLKPPEPYYTFSETFSYGPPGPPK